MTRVFLAAILGCAAAAGAQQRPSLMDPQHEWPIEEQMKYEKTPPQREDVDVLSLMHRDNAIHVRLGKLAQQRSTSALVKVLGADLVEDHSELDRKIVKLSKKLGFELAVPAPKDDAEKAQREAMAHRIEVLERLRGEDFDRSFARVMRDLHRQEIDWLESRRNDTRHMRVRAFYDEALPKLERHLLTAEELVRSNRAT
jgi:putative membrane protein